MATALLLKQNETLAARRRWLFACVDDTDGKTPKTGLNFTAGSGELQLSKNGAAWTNFVGSWGEIGSGLYWYEAGGAEVTDLGPVDFKVVKSGVRLAWFELAAVVGWDPYLITLGWPTQFAQNETDATRRRWTFVCVDDTDGKTPKTGLVFSGSEIQLTKNGGAFVDFTGGVTELGDGEYTYQGTAGELDTFGVLGFKVAKASVRLVLMQVGQVGPNPTVVVSSEATAIEVIAQRWVTAWTTLQPSVPFALGNEALPTAGLTGFANVTIGAIASKQMTQGNAPNRIFERRGVVQVKLFGAVDVGDAPLATLMGSVRDVLESQSLGGGGGTQPLQTYAVSTPQTVKQGSWYTKTATVPFVFYERG